LGWSVSLISNKSFDSVADSDHNPDLGIFNGIIYQDRIYFYVSRTGSKFIEKNNTKNLYFMFLMHEAHYWKN